MAKIRGVIRHPNGGFKAGMVGDLPIDEAVAAVREGRVKFDLPDYSINPEAVAIVLAGLGVGSLSELKRRLDRELQLEAALRDARPYVFQRIFPPGHPERDWRSETAEPILERVDEAINSG